jgi:hypothetical protein
MKKSGKDRDRTNDLWIFSPTLYQLSYLPEKFPGTVDTGGTLTIACHMKKEVAVSDRFLPILTDEPFKGVHVTPTAITSKSFVKASPEKGRHQ